MTRRVIGWAGAILLADLVGCSVAPAALDAARSDAPLDASAVDCEPLQLGLCTVVDTGAPCTGAFDERATFTPLTDDARVPLVTGPQGSRMIVLAVRARGIEPGDPSRPSSAANPILDVVVFDEAAHEVSRYRGRAGFAVDAQDASWLVQPEVLVVMDGAIAGTFVVVATLADRAGATRCGEVTLTTI